MLGAYLSFVSFTGMIMSLILYLYDGGYKKANAYLAGFLFLSSFFYLINYIFLFSHSPQLIAVVAGGLPALFYLTGPFAFFYVRSILRDDTRLSRNDYLHFLLFIIVLSGTVPYLFSGVDEKLSVARLIESGAWNSIGHRINFLFPVQVNLAFRTIHPLIYAVGIAILIYTYRQRLFIRDPGDSGFRVTRNWLLIFSGIFLLVAIVHLVIFVRAWLYDGGINFLSETLIWIAVLSSTYTFLLLALLMFPRILYGMPVWSVTAGHGSGETDVAGTSLMVPAAPASEPVEDHGEGHERYVQSYSDAYLKELDQRITEWVKKENYLKEECSLINVSQESGIPQHHLSYYFNTVLGFKFTDWRNGLRVDRAKSLLDQGVLKKTTMDALAASCGFSSQTTFNRAFKNIVGVSPSQYLKLKA